MENAKPKTVEVNGITVTVALDVMDDYELTEQLVINADPNATRGERLAALVRSYRILFGADYRRVKDELRAKNGGALPNAAMVEFANAVMAKVGELKN